MAKKTKTDHLDALQRELDSYLCTPVGPEQRTVSVILNGESGWGKTARVTQAFNKRFGPMNEKWLSFNGSNMDPFLDLVGIPRSVQREEDGVWITQYSRPEHIVNPNIEAVFIDEINRADRRVRNAVMDWIQFGQINGYRMPNLKTIWAAKNHEAGEGEHDYDVEEMDFAQLDRFDVRRLIPREFNMSYMVNRYGQKWANAATKWWKGEPSKIQNNVPARRLCKALDLHKAGLPIKTWVLPHEAGASKLLKALSIPDAQHKLEAIISKPAGSYEAELTQFLADPNNLSDCAPFIFEPSANANSFRNMDACLPCMSIEQQVAAYHKYPKVKQIILNAPKESYPGVHATLATGQNKDAADAAMAASATINKDLPAIQDPFVTSKGKVVKNKPLTQIDVQPLSAPTKTYNEADLTRDLAPFDLSKSINSTKALAVIFRSSSAMTEGAATLALWYTEFICTKMAAKTIGENAFFFQDILTHCMGILLEAGYLQNASTISDCFPKITSKVIRKANVVTNIAS